MRSLFLSGLAFTSFSVVMLLSFVGASYPSTKVGVNLILLVVFLLIIAGGINDAIKLYLEGYSSFNRDSLLIAFAPAFVVGIIFLVAIACGYYAAFQ